MTNDPNPLYLGSCNNARYRSLNLDTARDDVVNRTIDEELLAPF